jgi:hypothetical protein
VPYTGHVAPEPTDDPAIDRLVGACGFTLRVRRVGHRN